MPEVDVQRIMTTGGYSSYLKIAEGCDKHCTYCIIPKLRGSYRSHSMDYLIKQAESLAAQGVKELNIVAQETTVYGTDLYNGQKMLPELLKRLCRIEGLSWIRVLYCYPEEINEELIQVIKEEPKICHYLDLPIQHGSDAVLKRMGRRTTQAELRSIIGRLREEIPDIALRTTLIAGFPGMKKIIRKCCSSSKICVLIASVYLLIQKKKGHRPLRCRIKLMKLSKRHAVMH